jgi:two-component system NtrC family sensor kinase
MNAPRLQPWHRLLSLRVLVPLLLLAYACAFGVTTLQRNVRHREKQVEDKSREDLALQMMSLRGTLEYLLRTGQLDAARQAISALGANTLLSTAILVDDRGLVLAALQPAWIGQPVQAIWPEWTGPKASARRHAILAREKGEVWVSEDGHQVEGEYPLVLGPGGDHARKGLLHLQQDLSLLKAEQRYRAERYALRASLLQALVALLMGLLFHFVLGRRVKRLESAARKLAAGDLQVRAGLRGMDEVGRLGRAFDDMAERISHDQEALRRSETSFRTLIERSPDAIFVHRARRVLFANPAAAALLGHEREDEMRGLEVRELLMPGEMDPLTESPLTEAMREVHLRHSNGHPVFGEVVTFSIPFEGQPAWVSIARDITERRQVQEKLRSADRMVSLGTLAAGVAHELNNPLSYVLSNLRFAVDELNERLGAEQTLSGEQAKEILQSLQESLEGGERMRNIVRDLRSFSRREDERQGPVDIHAVLDSCASLARGELRHRAQLVKEYGQIPPVLGNESRLGQLFLNLLVNAAQAIPDGDAKGHCVRLTTVNAMDGWVEIAVQDTGVGIPPENLQRLFKPFFTTKPVGVGTGLGLSICHGIVTSMGGRIEVTSEVGKGTTFRVFMPTAPPAAAP